MNPEVEFHLRALRSSDASRRSEAALALGRIGDAVAVPFLRERLFDPDRRMSEYAAEALGRIEARSNPELQAALEDADAFASEQAGETLDGIVPPSTSVLLRALRTTDGFVDECVVEALGRIGRAVVPRLLEALQDPNGLVRGSAAKALGRIGDPTAVPALLELLKDSNTFTVQSTAGALSSYGSAVVPALLEALRDPRSRKGAVMTLGKIGDASVTPALLQAMLSKEFGCAPDYRLAFQRIGPSARPYLLEALHDPYEFTREKAVYILGAIGDSSDVPALVEALQDPGRFGHVRSSAAWALRAIRHPSAIPALLEALRDKHEAVRASVVMALGAFEDPTIVPPLIKALGDSSLLVRQRALDVFTERDSAVIPVLQRTLLDPTEAIRIGAATALLRIHEDPELPRQILLLPDVTPDRKSAALAALEKAHHPIPTPMNLCRQLIADPDPHLRQAAQEVLLFLNNLERETTPQQPPPVRRFSGGKFR